jgi:3-oxoacyl-(acyl-carrier-protein) synthase
MPSCDAFRLVQRGFAKGMICGGTEAAVTPLGLAGFASAKPSLPATMTPSWPVVPLTRIGMVLLWGKGQEF